MLYPNIIKSSAENLNPALIANYIYDIVKTFNSYYQSVSILKIEDKLLSDDHLDNLENEIEQLFKLNKSIDLLIKLKK